MNEDHLVGFFFGTFFGFVGGILAIGLVLGVLRAST